MKCPSGGPSRREMPRGNTITINMFPLFSIARLAGSWIALDSCGDDGRMVDVSRCVIGALELMSTLADRFGDVAQYKGRSCQR